jgi:hypothetical protein
MSDTHGAAPDATRDATPGREHQADAAAPARRQLAAGRRITAYLLLLAVMGAVAAMSWAGIYAWARGTLDWSPGHAALVPIALDIAAMTCALLALDSIAKGEAATMLRVLTAAFVGLSAWVNWRRAVGTGNIAEQLFFPAMSVLAYALVHAVMGKYRREVRRDLAGHGHREALAELPRLGAASWARYPGRTFAVHSAHIAARLEAAEARVAPRESRAPAPAVADTTRDMRDTSRPARTSATVSATATPSASATRRAPAHRGTDSDIASMKLADAIRAGLEAVGEHPREVVAWLAEHGRPGVPATRVHDVIRRDRTAQAAAEAEAEVSARKPKLAAV